MRAGRLWAAATVVLLVVWVDQAVVWTCRRRSLAAVSRSQLRGIRIALESYRAEHGVYPGQPDANEDTRVTLYRALLEEGGEPGPYLAWDPAQVGELDGDPVLIDPWGRPIEYRIDAAGYDVASAGADGALTFSADDHGFWRGGEVYPARAPRRSVPLIAVLGLTWLVWLGSGACCLRRLAGRVHARWLARRPAPRLVYAITPRRDDVLRCAWCHDHDAGELLTGCERCGVTLHADCWALSSRCPTLGCAPRPPRRIVLRPAGVVRLQPA